MTKETLLIASIVIAIIIGAIVYDYQVRKQGRDLAKRISEMGKKVVKSPITAMAFIWAWILGNEKD